VSGKYAFIDAEKARYPIVKMCIWLDVSTSGYYEWVDRPPSATAQRRTRLAALVQAIFDESDGTYGYRRVHAALARQDEDCDPELVRDITSPPSCSTSLEPKQDQTFVSPAALPQVIASQKLDSQLGVITAVQN
jgi:hypothetical protein